MACTSARCACTLATGMSGAAVAGAVIVPVGAAAAPADANRALARTSACTLRVSVLRVLIGPPGRPPETVTMTDPAGAAVPPFGPDPRTEHAASGARAGPANV